MKPYYDDGQGIVIYCGDCREMLTTVKEECVELLLTDPPYGIAYNPGGGGRGWSGGNGWMKGKSYSVKDSVVGDNKPFDPSHLLRFRRLVLWGGNHYANCLPSSPTWLVWNKRRPNDTPNDFADCEIAWSNLGGPARAFWHEWKGAMRASERAVHYHPTQKPVALMRWCLELDGGDGLVLDPYMGSGATLVAARDLGRKAIGIETEEKYCEIAAKRLEKGFAWRGLAIKNSRKAKLVGQGFGWQGKLSESPTSR